MKKIIIISTYPNTEGKINTLDECVDSLSGFGYDLMIVSHLPVPEYITKKVEYFLYDSENGLLPKSISPFFWTQNNSFSARIESNYHSLSILKNIYNGLNFVKLKEYDFFYFLESDNIFSDKDRGKLENLRNGMVTEEKKLIFFSYKPIDVFITDSNFSLGNQIYETLIFGGYVNYFLNIYKIPTNIDGYVELFTIKDLPIYMITLEKHFYFAMNVYQDQFLIINRSSSDYFDTSVINKFTKNFICQIIKSENNENLILFIYNSSEHKCILNIKNNSIEIYPDCWFYDIFNHDIEVKVHKEGLDMCDKYLFIYEDFINGKEEIMGTIRFH